MNLALRGSLFVCMVLTSCSSPPQGTPPDPNAPTEFWGIAYNHSLDNTLTGRGTGPNDRGSTVAQWEAIMKGATGLTSVKLEQRYQWTALPSDQGLDFNSSQSFIDFVESYKQSEISFFEGRYPNEWSILLGINTPANVPTDNGGEFGFRRGAFSGFEFAISFVLRHRIFYVLQIPGGEDIEQKWRYTQYTVLHALGHARGLSTQNNPDYDHGEHGGSNSDICVMISPLLPSPVPADHLFCGRHNKVLSQCLTLIQPYYDPSSVCALGPYQ